MQSRLINRAVTPREAGDERAAQGRADDESEHRLFDKKRRRTTGASGSYDVTLEPLFGVGRQSRRCGVFEWRQ
jgi:hypothetical protein